MSKIINLKENLKILNEQIQQEILKSGRDKSSVKLLAVSKTVKPEIIKEAFDLGQNLFGENYIQEALQKAKSDILLNINSQLSWHFIGHLQTNKAKSAIELFDVIHSVDSLKLAKILNSYASKVNKIQKIMLEINIGEENSKTGINQDSLKFLIESILNFKNLELIGLMIIPPFLDNPEDMRFYFSKLYKLFWQIKNEFKIKSFQELSMGMTHDFKIAIQEGATIIRVGTAIFGKR